MALHFILLSVVSWFLVRGGRVAKETRATSVACLAEFAQELPPQSLSIAGECCEEIPWSDTFPFFEEMWLRPVMSFQLVILPIRTRELRSYLQLRCFYLDFRRPVWKDMVAGHAVHRVPQL